MNTSTKIQPTSSSQSTKNATRPTYPANSNPSKSTYQILRDAGFRSMNDFMFSHGLKLHNDEHLAQTKEMIERMKEEDSRGEDLRRLEFGRGSDEDNMENDRGVESSEEEYGAAESIGFLDVESGEEGEDRVEVGEEIGMVTPREEGSDVKSSEEEYDVAESVGFVDVETVEDFGYDDLGGGDNDGYEDLYDDQDDFQDDFEDDFEDD